MNLNEDPKIIFTITNVEDSYISFTSSKSKKQFKIFVREITEEGRNLRNQARLQMNILKNQEDASENKETQS